MAVTGEPATGGAPPPAQQAERPDPPTARRRRSRVRLLGALVVVIAALGFLLWKGLGDAALYFRNVDEVVAERDGLIGQRFRLQGSVVEGTVVQGPGGVEFDVEHGGERLHVRHRGDPPELFQPGIPVVLEGRLGGDVFESDRIFVKHSSEYRTEHPDRLDGAGVDAGTTPDGATADGAAEDRGTAGP